MQFGGYYGATFVEAQLCGGEEVIVVGGGNSAGQAAVFLAQTARRVHMWVRSGDLTDSMSRYLIRRIEDNPAIVLRTHTEIVALEGNGCLERVRSRDNVSMIVETRDIKHVFLGMAPCRHTLARGCVALDPREFVQTGPDLSTTIWRPQVGPLTRPPYVLERACRGVFAVGDVRSGNIKRVASAVGKVRLRSPWCIRCCSSDTGC